MKKSELEKLKREMFETVRRLSTTDYDFNIDERGDEIDAAQGALLVGMTYDQRSRSNNRIEEINDALLRMKEGIYGRCEECDEDISVKRLQICPETRYCIRCAELLEKARKGFRR